MPEIIVVLHDIRSTYNVGSVFRTCEGFGVQRIICSGYTPYPAIKNDPRLPHIRLKLAAQIHKTALGAENMVPFGHADTPPLLALKKAGYTIAGLEQHPSAIQLPRYAAPKKVALILGEEVKGIPSEILAICDDIIEIPMIGQKESFNVSVAAGIALYGLTAI